MDRPRSGSLAVPDSNEVVYALPPEGTFDPQRTTRGVPNLKTTNVRMRLLGTRRARGTGEKPLDGYSNDFLGKHENCNRSEGESTRTE
jgi:hypothetical protein